MKRRKLCRPAIGIRRNLRRGKSIGWRLECLRNFQSRVGCFSFFNYIERNSVRSGFFNLLCFSRELFIFFNVRYNLSQGDYPANTENIRYIFWYILVYRGEFRIGRLIRLASDWPRYNLLWERKISIAKWICISIFDSLAVSSLFKKVSIKYSRIIISKKVFLFHQSPFPGTK